jgi:hypothetical protein
MVLCVWRSAFTVQFGPSTGERCFRSADDEKKYLMRLGRGAARSRIQELQEFRSCRMGWLKKLAFNWEMSANVVHHISALMCR